jgi:methylmalonyl-CoA decarboxylase
MSGCQRFFINPPPHWRFDLRPRLRPTTSTTTLGDADRDALMRMNNFMALIKKILADHVGTITLDNPKSHNALSSELITDVLQAMDDLSAEGARVVVLRASPGAKVWSAGHDVKELPTTGRDPLTYNDPLRHLIRTIQKVPVPVIAMVEGSVWGGACEVVLCCDIIVAAAGSSFAMTPAKLGVPYDVAGVLNFMQRIDLPIAKELLFTAQPISAERALDVGFVNHVVPIAELETQPAKLAADITRNSPLVIALLKEQLRVLSAATPLTPEGFERIQALRRQIYDSVDYQEGIRSFFEKRPPQFHGN